MRHTLAKAFVALVTTAIASLVSGRIGGELRAAEPAARLVQPDASGRYGTQVVGVDMKEFLYVPAELTVQPGTVVVWTNSDPVAHNVHVLSDAALNELDASIVSELVGPGGRVAIRFDRPGIYPYVCDPHPFMTGTVVVRAGGP